jgi:hypothetical protein
MLPGSALPDSLPLDRLKPLEIVEFVALPYQSGDSNERNFIDI